MKKLMIAVLLLVTALVIPFAVNAEENNEVNVYLFRGEGCPHCQEAEEWFAAIEEEYGSKFNVVDYETWYNEENQELMKRVAKARGEEAQGVPYIIIGNQSWNGFTESYESEMISKIESEYAKSESDRYDIMKLLPSLVDKKEKDSTGSDILALIIILAVVGGICFGVYKARSKTK